MVECPNCGANLKVQIEFVARHLVGGVYLTCEECGFREEVEFEMVRVNGILSW